MLSDRLLTTTASKSFNTPPNMIIVNLWTKQGYGAVHLDTATFVQQNSKTNFRRISYPSCEKALINHRKTSTREIFNISKTEKVINFQLWVILPHATNY